MKKRSLLSLVVVALAGLGHAVVITQWNFNSPVPDGATTTGSSIPSTGGGSITLLNGVTNPGFNSGFGSTDPAASDNSGYQTTTYANQGTGDKARGVQFNVSTVGKTNIVVNWDLRHSNTSSRYSLFQYSINGSTFIDFGSAMDGNAGDTWFNNNLRDLTGVAGVSDNANFAFRVVATFAPGTQSYAASNLTSSYGASGTYRFDMVTVSGTNPVPEPATMSVLSLGALSLIRRKKA